MNYENYLVTINVPPSLEEALADCLLSFERAQSISSFSVGAYHHHNQGLSLADQVFGRQRKICFQMYVDSKSLAALLKRVTADFSGAGLQYWVAPIIEQGEI